MKNLLRLEEAAICGFSVFLFSQTNFSWWWYPLLIFTPDIGMLGYTFGTKIGAYIYNFFHHRAVAIFTLCLGWYLYNDWTVLAGIILLGHSAMDRVFDFGLKFNNSFYNTHLGWLKNQKLNKNELISE